MYWKKIFVVHKRATNQDSIFELILFIQISTKSKSKTQINMDQLNKNYKFVTGLSIIQLLFSSQSFQSRTAMTTMLKLRSDISLTAILFLSL